MLQLLAENAAICRQRLFYGSTYIAFRAPLKYKLVGRTVTNPAVQAFVCVHDDQVAVRFGTSESDPPDESICLDDVVRIVLENVPTGDQPWCLHWYLRHRDGWTLHFNSAFVGAPEVARQLEECLGFQVPALNAIAGPGGLGTAVWAV